MKQTDISYHNYLKGFAEKLCIAKNINTEAIEIFREYDWEWSESSGVWILYDAISCWILELAYLYNYSIVELFHGEFQVNNIICLKNSQLSYFLVFTI